MAQWRHRLPNEWESSNERFRQVLKEAMETITNKTTYLTFRERSPAETSHAVRFTDSSSGCFAYMGRRSYELKLGRGCVFKGIAIHELMHVAGRHHVHMRGDRDNFITINEENIQRGKERNFAKLSLSSSRYDHNLPYDYDSIMHCKPFHYSWQIRPSNNAIIIHYYPQSLLACGISGLIHK